MQTLLRLWNTFWSGSDRKINISGYLGKILQFGLYFNSVCMMRSNKLSLHFSFALVAIHPREAETAQYFSLIFSPLVFGNSQYFGSIRLVRYIPVWWIMNAFLTCCCLLRSSFMEWCKVFFQCNTDRFWIESCSGPTLFFKETKFLNVEKVVLQFPTLQLNETGMSFHLEGSHFLLCGRFADVVVSATDKTQ